MLSTSSAISALEGPDITYVWLFVCLFSGSSMFIMSMMNKGIASNGKLESKLHFMKTEVTSDMLLSPTLMAS